VTDLGSTRPRAQQQPKQRKGGNDRGGVAASVHQQVDLADGEA
jgi:hypothetical protein